MKSPNDSALTIPLSLTFRGMPHSDGLEAAIRSRAAELERFGPLLGCHVMVEAPHRSHRQGKIYHVRVRLTLAGTELVVNRDPAEHHAHEDPYVAVRDAFDAARRQVEDRVRERHGRVKTHAAPASGEVLRLLPDRDCGFLRTIDEREIYFHRNSVVRGGYDRLTLGSPVRFTEEEGEDGPQASSVVRLKRRPLVVAEPLLAEAVTPVTRRAPAARRTARTSTRPGR